MGSDKPDITIRQLSNHDEYLQCLHLQRETWGQNFMEVVSPAIQMVSQKLGGVTAGAFNQSGKLIGFVFGMTGLKDGKPVHWSDMLSVRPEWQGKGIGRKLKLFQRDEVRKIGVKMMYWTYDPLEAGNTYLNIICLGAGIVEYVENMYATDEGSSLHAGLGMDRFIVRWNLSEDSPEHEFPSPDEKSAPVINTNEQGQPVESDFLDSPIVQVEIPVSIQKTKTESPDTGLKWRLNTRRVFQHYLAHDYSIDNFHRDNSVNRCFYILKKSGSW
jgi:predicted GNAT superfamily acetyltransferase